MAPEVYRISRALLLAAVLAAGSFGYPRVSMAAEDDPATARARSAFEAGTAHMQQARYEDAYRAFREAYALAPRWQILQPLGIACLHLERYGEAIEALEKFLAEGGAQIDPALREQTERDVATLKPSLVHVVLSFDRSEVTLLDERLQGTEGQVVVTNRYDSVPGTLTLGVRAGRHRMTATSPLTPGKKLVWEFDTQQPNVTLSHRFLFEPPPAAKPLPEKSATQPPPPPMEQRGPSTGFYIAAAGTGALLIAGTTTGILALSTRSRFEEKNDGRHVDEANSLREDGQRFSLVTDVLLGATVLAAGATTYLYFSGRRGREAQAAAAGARRTWSVSPVVGTAGAGVNLEGRF